MRQVEWDKGVKSTGVAHSHTHIHALRKRHAQWHLKMILTYAGHDSTYAASLPPPCAEVALLPAVGADLDCLCTGKGLQLVCRVPFHRCGPSTVRQYHFLESRAN